MWIAAGVAHATVNAEALAARVSEPGWAFEGKGDLGLYSGNLNMLDVGGSVSLRHQRLFEEEPQWMASRFLVTANYRRLVVFGNTFTHQALAHARYTHQLTRHVGLDGFAQAQFNELQALEWRTVGGVGGRFVLWQEAQLGVWAGTGYMLEAERWTVDPADDFPESRLNHRWTNYLSARVASGDGRLSATNTVYFQPRFDDFSDYHLFDELGGAIAATPHLSFTTTLTTQLDTVVPDGVETLNVSLRSGLAVSW